MSNISTDNHFIQLLTGCQNRLYAFIFSLLGNADQAQDVLQETNRVLWEEAERFEPGSNFMAWALQIAYNQVRTHRRKASRDCLTFDDQVLEEIAAEAAEYDEALGDRQQALVDCLDKLPPRQQMLIRGRYYHGLSVKALAARVERSDNAVAVALLRIRTVLMHCIERSLASST